MYLVYPVGCGTAHMPCASYSSMVMGVFYFVIYLIAFGYGGYDKNISIFGADQFDNEQSRTTFFHYFHLTHTVASFLSDTVLTYLEENNQWAVSFMTSGATAAMALLLFTATQSGATT